MEGDEVFEAGGYKFIERNAFGKNSGMCTVDVVVDGVAKTGGALSTVWAVLEC